MQNKNSLIMLILLGLLVFVHSLGSVFYSLRGIDPHPTFEFLYDPAFVCGVVWWLRAEVKKSPVTRLYCEGLMASSGWAFIIPYHLLKTRGIRGLIPLFALLGTFVFAWIIGGVIFVAFSS